MGTQTANEMSDGAVLAALLLAKEDWLMQRVQEYAMRRGGAPRSSALAGVWRPLVAGLTAAIVAGVEHAYGLPGSRLESSALAEPAVRLRMTEAYRTHTRRYSAAAFLAMFGCFEQSFLDLVERADLSEDRKRAYGSFVGAVFEGLEAIFRSEWRSVPAGEGGAGVESSARSAKLGESAYLAVFERLQVPVLLLDADGRVRDMNRQAARLVDLALVFEWGEGGRDSDAAGPPSEGRRGYFVEELFPWLPSVDRLLSQSSMEDGFECTHAVGSAVRVFEGRVSGLFDTDRNPVGAVVVLNDVSGYKAIAERLDYLANTDDLTQVNNRRRFFELAHQETLRARRYRRDFSMLLIDVDDFKHVNDTYGHAVGDELLVGLAQAMQATLRRTDALGRVGGEEFAIALPETGEEATRVAAERLRARVAGTPVATAIGQLAVTVSVGTATLASSDLNLEDLLRRADRALYEAKAAGKDCVVQSRSAVAHSTILGTPGPGLPRGDMASDPFQSVRRR